MRSDRAILGHRRRNPHEETQPFPDAVLYGAQLRIVQYCGKLGGPAQRLRGDGAHRTVHDGGQLCGDQLRPDFLRPDPADAAVHLSDPGVQGGLQHHFPVGALPPGAVGAQPCAGGDHSAGEAHRRHALRRDLRGRGWNHLPPGVLLRGDRHLGQDFERKRSSGPWS